MTSRAAFAAAFRAVRRSGNSFEGERLRKELILPLVDSRDLRSTFEAKRLTSVAKADELYPVARLSTPADVAAAMASLASSTSLPVMARTFRMKPLAALTVSPIITSSLSFAAAAVSPSATSTCAVCHGWLNSSAARLYHTRGFRATPLHRLAVRARGVSGDGGDTSEGDNIEDARGEALGASGGGNSGKEGSKKEKKQKTKEGKEKKEKKGRKKDKGREDPEVAGAVESGVKEIDTEKLEFASGDTVVLYKADDGVWEEAKGPVAEGVETLVLKQVGPTQVMDEEAADAHLGDEEDDEWEFEEEDMADLVPGDGLDGGGFVLSGAAWGQTALELAQEVLAGAKYQGDYALYGFKVYPEKNWIRVRLDKLSDVYGSPRVEDIDSFLLDFNARVIAAGERGELPADIQIEVSSPGAERVVKVPEDLNRFKELPMYVHYQRPEGDDTGAASKGDVGAGGATSEEILSLVELDEEERVTIWKVADVRLNRELYGGKGRPLNRKQRDRRIRIPYSDILVVRIYLDY